jgi:hypothetical protein
MKIVHMQLLVQLAQPVAQLWSQQPKHGKRKGSAQGLCSSQLIAAA